jgi:7,8-dihydropterin-6-yl-methyl-4-(beta-D-ribofuranosyl)aminobenzene 5'-phosphate synthase
MNLPARVDRIEILVLVDNVTDSLSTTPEFVETEFRRVVRRGGRVLSGSCLCCGAHGLSCAITAWRGQTSKTLLFDTGPDVAVFERNVERLGFDISTVDGMVLSHGHWDHGGAMLRALDMILASNGGRPIPVYMHPGMYWTRATRSLDGSMVRFEDVPTAKALEAHGGRVVHSTTAQTVLDDLFFVSGEIPRVTPFETGLPNQHRLRDDGSWEPDPLIIDERFVAVDVEGKGVVVFTACSHAGVVNVMKHARECFEARPMHGVMGGFHLSGATEKIIPETVEALQEFDLALVAAAHCTGWRAVGALEKVFGDKVVPSAVGKSYRL